MSIDDSKEKINPVKGREGSQRPSAFNGVKQFFNETIESEKGKDVLIVIIVILVGIGSFELGRLSKENSSGGLKILPATANVIYATDQLEALPQSGGKTPNSPSTGKTFFASSRGSKYYTTSCAAGKTIKQENRIYFATGEEAQTAGYTLSSSCN